MNTQENIIALLQGELVDDPTVMQLLLSLVGSAENRRFLIDQIALTNGYDQLIAKSVPSASASAAVWNKIDQYELQQNTFGSSSSLSAVTPGKKALPIIIGSSLIALVIGFFLGYWQSQVTEGTDLANRPKNSSSDEIVAPKETATSKSPVVNVKDKAGTRGELIKKSVLSTSSKGSGIFNAVHLAFPNHGGAYIPGSKIPLVLNAKSRSPLSIEYSPDGGLQWNPISTELLDGQQVWRVPDTIGTSSIGIFRVSTISKLPLIPDYIFSVTANINCIAISPDGALLATGEIGGNPRIVLWNLNSGKQVRVLSGHRNSVILIKFNSDGSKLVSGSIDSTAILWDVGTGNIDHVFEGKRGRIWPAVFSPDDQTVATGNDDGSITLWNVQNGAEISTFSVHAEAIRYLEFSSRGDWLLTASTDGTASIVDVKTGELVQVFVHHIQDAADLSYLDMDEYRAALRKNIVNGIQVFPDKGIAVTCGYDGYVKYWDIASGELIRSRVYHAQKEVSELHATPDKRWMASVGYDGSTKIIDPNTGAVALELRMDTVPMTRCAFTPDSHSMGIAHIDGRISLWKLPLDSVDLSDEFIEIRHPGFSKDLDPEQ